MAQKAPAPLPPGLYATFNTSQGTIVATLYEKYTPESVRNFVGLAQGTKAWRDPKTNAMVKRPMYDNLTFHRVLHGKMIQSGDPTGTSAHNCGFTVRDEFLIGLQFDRPDASRWPTAARPIPAHASSSSRPILRRNGTRSTRSSGRW